MYITISAQDAFETNFMYKGDDVLICKNPKSRDPPIRLNDNGRKMEDYEIIENGGGLLRDKITGKYVYNYYSCASTVYNL